jgi:hypothetical protein
MFNRRRFTRALFRESTRGDLDFAEQSEGYSESPKFSRRDNAHTNKLMK